MRWRGLASPWRPWPAGCRLPCAAWLPPAACRCQIAGYPAPQHPRAFPRAGHVFGGEAVLLPSPRSTQGLCPRHSKFLWPSTGHLPFIPCAPELSTALSTSSSTGWGERRPAHPALSGPAAVTEEPEKQVRQAARQRGGHPGPRRGEDDPVSTDRRRVRAAVTARQRGQGRLRAVTVAVGVASVLAGGTVAAVLPGAATAQSTASSGSGSHAATSGTSSGRSGTSGSSASGSSTSGSGSSSGKSGKSSSATSGSSGLKSSAAPSSSSGSSQVTSGGS
jgi:hypothetical protein